MKPHGRTVAGKLGGGGRVALLCLALVLLGGCMPALLAGPALPTLEDAAGGAGNPPALAPARLADYRLAALLAQPTGQAGSMLLACVAASSGAFRFINDGATPAGTGMNRACSVSEQLKTWTTLGALPRLYACVNTGTGAGRFINEGATPAGTGKNRACAASPDYSPDGGERRLAPDRRLQQVRWCLANRPAGRHEITALWTGE